MAIERYIQQVWKETSKFCKFNLTTILKLSPRRKVRNLNLPEPFHRGQRQSRGPRTGQTGCTAGGSCSRLYRNCRTPSTPHIRFILSVIECNLKWTFYFLEILLREKFKNFMISYHHVETTHHSFECRRMCFSVLNPIEHTQEYYIWHAEDSNLLWAKDS